MTDHRQTRVDKAEESGRKQQRSESFSLDEEANGPCMKSRKGSNAISFTISIEEVQNLLHGVNGGSTHKNDNMKVLKTKMK